VTSLYRDRLHVRNALSGGRTKRSGRIMHGGMPAHVEMSVPIVNAYLLAGGTCNEVSLAITQRRADLFA
jgi:hypothetical protein